MLCAKKISKCPHVFSQSSALENDVVLHLNKLIPLYLTHFEPSLLQTGLVVLEKKMKCEKLTTTTKTDNRQISIQIPHLRRIKFYSFKNIRGFLQQVYNYKVAE